MNRNDLVKSVRAGMSCTPEEAEQAVANVIAGIETGIKKDGDVTIAGFGSFKVKDRAAREGRNPRTGESIAIAASQTVKFRPAASFKEEIA